MKKLLALVLALITICSCFAITASAHDATDAPPISATAEGPAIELPSHGNTGDPLLDADSWSYGLIKNQLGPLVIVIAVIYYFVSFQFVADGFQWVRNFFTGLFN